MGLDIDKCGYSSSAMLMIVFRFLLEKALRNIAQVWDNYLGGITDEELMEDILYLKVPSFLAYIRSKHVLMFPYRDDATEAIKLALNPERIKQLEVPEIKKLIEKQKKEFC